MSNESIIEKYVINFINWVTSLLKGHWLFFLAMIIIVVLFWDKWDSYNSPVSYEESVTFSRKTDSAFKNTHFIKSTFKTDKAFIPYEKIIVHIEFATTDSTTQSELLYKKKLYISLQHAELTGSKINKKNKLVKPPLSESEKAKLATKGKLINKFSNTEAVILLSPSKDPDIFIGEGEVIYKKQGSYESNIFIESSPLFPNTVFKIDIGSSVETMNKKTNDLLYLIAIFSFFLAVYSEFKPKSQPPFLKGQSRNPTQ